ncbi:hypothetical protein FHG87_003247 [Trinorchestia longiramus]|nr:hypothetical protein FHG87_003247 [Trinorchestia longiramus]
MQWVGETSYYLVHTIIYYVLDSPSGYEEEREPLQPAPLFSPEVTNDNVIAPSDCQLFVGHAVYGTPQKNLPACLSLTWV